jgi:hypothetical protein
MYWAVASPSPDKQLAVPEQISGVISFESGIIAEIRIGCCAECRRKGRRSMTTLGIQGYFAPPVGRALARKARLTPPLALLKTFAPPRRTLLNQTHARLYGLYQSPVCLTLVDCIARDISSTRDLYTESARSKRGIRHLPTTEFS